MKPVVFTPAAARQFRKLPDNVRKRIAAKVRGYAEGESADVTKLVGREGARLRIGDYRAIFIEDAASIIIVAVGNRKEIYD